MVSLEQLSAEVEELGPLPLAASKLAQLLDNPHMDLGEVVVAIRYDQGLTATILRYANSAASAPSTPVQTVRDALIRLGVGKVLGLALALWVRSPMAEALPAYGFGERELWRHSAACALATEVLDRHIPERLPSLIFTAALLHDVGKLVLARHLNHENLEAIWRRMVPLETTYAQAEEQTLGFGHAQLGARIVERWNLTRDIVLAIRNHHRPEATDDPVCAAVQVCNLAAKTVGCGVGYEGVNLVTAQAALERFNLSRTTFERLCAEVAVVLPQVEQEFV